MLTFWHAIRCARACIWACALRIWACALRSAGVGARGRFVRAEGIAVGCALGRGGGRILRRAHRGSSTIAKGSAAPPPAAGQPQLT